MHREEPAVTAHVILITCPRTASALRETVATSKPTKSPLPSDRMLRALPADQLVAIARELGVKGLSERMTHDTLVRRITAAAAGMPRRS
jgi:hypothetical protein